jgi:uncharacterized protein YbaR (Trm112 family)
VFLELVGAFRCPRPHDLTWLVALALDLEDRDIVEGELGCPTCGARYPVVDGVVDFRGDAVASARRRTVAPDARALSELAMRAAALLALTEPGGVAVLTGTWAAAAHDVVALTENVNVLAIDPPYHVASGFGVSVALASDVLPLRPMSVRAIALDTAHATTRFAASSVAALLPHGRLLAPVATALPDGITELARDQREWVGERLQSVKLGRGKRASASPDRG